VAYLRVYQSRGDPFLGGIFKKAIGLVGKVTGLSGPKINFPATMPGIGAVGRTVGRAVGKFPGGKKGALLAGGALGAGALLGAGGEAMMGGGRRKYRRMNVGNTKALKRSMRRVQGFAKLARSTMTFTTHHKLKKPRRR